MLYGTSTSSTTVQSLPLNLSPLHRHFRNRSGGYSLEQPASNAHPFVDRSGVHTESDGEEKRTLLYLLCGFCRCYNPLDGNVRRNDINRILCRDDEHLFLLETNH